MANRIRVIHIITRLILGGAQENTALTLEGLHKSSRYHASLITGPPEHPQTEGELIGRLDRHNIPIVLLPALGREIRPLKDLVVFIQLFFIFCLERPHIVHTHSSKAGILGRLAARLAGVPMIIHTIHGLPFHPYESRWRNLIFHWLERLASSLSTHIITVGEVMKTEAIRARLGPPSKFSAIYSGIEMGLYTPEKYNVIQIKRRLGIPEGKPVVGCISRLVPLKGHEYLLDAAGRLAKEGEDFLLLLVGDGSLRSEIESRVRQAGLEKHVRLFGLIPSDRIPEMISLMDFVVHPSLREGLPRAVVQAMAMGKPTIAFDIDGAREVIVHGVTGYLLKPGSVDGLADAIREFLHHPESVAAKGLARMRRIRDRFSADRMVEEINSLYQRLREQKIYQR